MFFKNTNTVNNLADEELIDRYKNSGDALYAGILFQRYSHLIFGVCLKYLKNRDDSKDAVMNIFEKLLTDLKRHKVLNFRSWIHMVSRNHCLMYLRKNSSNKEISKENGEEFMEFTLLLHPIEDSVSEESLSKLDDCIEKLIDEQKRCISLFYLQEKCYKEISEQTGFEMSKVKSYIQNGKRNLKLCIERN